MPGICATPDASVMGPDRTALCIPNDALTIAGRLHSHVHITTILHASLAGASTARPWSPEDSGCAQLGRVRRRFLGRAGRYTLCLTGFEGSAALTARTQMPPSPERSPERPAERHLPIVTRSRGLGAPRLAAPRDSDRTYRPRFAVWELTLACTSRCRHCGSRAGEARPEELSTEECLRLADALIDLGVMEVSLIGGEAFLHPGFFEVVRRFSERDVQVGLATGGVGVDAELARAARAAGLSSASVSIDGIGRTHDALRGVRHGYQRALEAVRHLQAAGIYVGMNSQINRQNLREIPELAELCVELELDAWQVALTVAMGNAADRPELLLQPYDLLEVVPALARAKERLAQRDILLYPGNNIGYFGPHETALRGGSKLGHYASCGAGRSVIGIESSGDVKGCPSLPSNPYVGGNVRREPLVDIWERAPALRFGRDRGTDDLWGYCKSCYYASECKAGCTWTSHALFGRSGNNPYCHHRALDFASRGEREVLRQVARAPGDPFDHGRFEIHIESSEGTPR